MYLSVFTALLAVLFGAGEGTITLQPLSTVYLPWEYNNDGTLDYDLDKGAAEQVAFHPGHQMVYAIGVKGLLSVIDVTDPTSARVVHTQELPDAKVATYNDLVICGDYIALIQSNPVEVLPGTLYIYGIFNSYSDLQLLQQVQIGPSPSAVRFTSDCATLVVVNEGKDGLGPSGNFVNPAGSVNVIDFDIANAAASGSLTVNTVDFTRFDAQQDDYAARGVRWVHRGEGTGASGVMSQELEPEDFVFDETESKIYVTLQENNAVAVVDITTLTVDEIYPLGAKNWANYMFDPSDKDNGISMRNWGVYGLYQPDAIAFFTTSSGRYLVTADEGNTRELEIGNFEFTDEWKGSDFMNSNNGVNVPSRLAAALRDDGQLGVLRISNFDGKSASDPNTYEALYTFGGRGFSVWNADDLTQVWNSGSDVEMMHANYYPQIFNCEFDDDHPEHTPRREMDEASKKKGPETESITVAELNGNTVLFIGNERTSTMMVYSVDAATGIPSFESIYRAGNDRKSWAAAYADREIGDIDPEHHLFVAAADSPSGAPLLVVAGNLSGTVSVYQVVDN